MSEFEEEVVYFVELVYNNVKEARKKGKKKFDIVFNNVNIRLDGEEVILYNFEKDYVYSILKKDIENSQFWHFSTKLIAEKYIEMLSKYNKKEITFETLMTQFNSANKLRIPVIVMRLLDSKTVIGEQLILLRENKDIPEVKEYIEGLYNNKYVSPNIIYLIDKYYYQKENLKSLDDNVINTIEKFILQ